MEDSANACQKETSDSANLSSYFYVFLAAQILNGIGCTPLFSLGVCLLDECVSVHQSSLYLGRSILFHFIIWDLFNSGCINYDVNGIINFVQGRLYISNTDLHAGNAALRLSQSQHQHEFKKVKIGNSVCFYKNAIYRFCRIKAQFRRRYRKSVEIRKKMLRPRNFDV